MRWVHDCCEFMSAVSSWVLWDPECSEFITAVSSWVLWVHERCGLMSDVSSRLGYQVLALNPGHSQKFGKDTYTDTQTDRRRLLSCSTTKKYKNYSEMSIKSTWFIHSYILYQFIACNFSIQFKSLWKDIIMLPTNKNIHLLGFFLKFCILWLKWGYNRIFQLRRYDKLLIKS